MKQISLSRFSNQIFPDIDSNFTEAQGNDALLLKSINSSWNFKGAVATTDSPSSPATNDVWRPKSQGTFTNFGGVSTTENYANEVIVKSSTGYTVETLNEASRAGKIAAGLNVFASNANGSKLSQLEKFIIDIKAISGFSSDTRYYIDEFRVNDNEDGYKLTVKDESDTTILTIWPAYTAPTTYPEKTKDTIIFTYNSYSIQLTVNWDYFVSLIFNESTLSGYEINNHVLFGNKLDDVESRTTASETEIIEINNKVGVVNKSLNKLTNYALDGTTGWSGVSTSVENGVVYFGVANNYISQTVAISLPAGTNIICAAKMKSIASTDFFMSVQVFYTDATSDFTRIYKNDGESFLIEEGGYYQLIHKITAEKAVSSVKINLTASYAGGTGTYNAGEGVYATQPFVSTYEDNEEFYFDDNDYFPLDRIYDYATIALLAKQVEQSIKDEIKANTISDLVKFESDIKINMLGDSFTLLGYDDNRGFIYFAASYLGLAKATNFVNYGEGGTRIANNSLTVTDPDAMVNRYNEMGDADALGIMGGYNDTIAPFATWAEKIGSVSTKSDTNTIWGAYCTIIEGFKAMYPYSNCSIFLMTYPYDKNDADKVTLMSTIKEIGAYYNLPVLDFYSLCGFKYGLNCDLGRASLTDGYTWIDEHRISYNDGVTIWDSTVGDTIDWSYIADYIDVSAYSVLAIPTSDVTVLKYFYNGSGYDYLGYNNSYEARLGSNCTHIRVAIKTSKKTNKITIEDGEFVTDGTHPNLIGFRDKMAQSYAEFLERILKRKNS